MGKCSICDAELTHEDVSAMSKMDMTIVCQKHREYAIWAIAISNACTLCRSSLNIFHERKMNVEQNLCKYCKE